MRRAGSLRRSVCIAAAVVFGVGAPPARAVSDEYSSPAIVDLPVRFTVVNRDSSNVVCPTDGQTYTVVGHLVGPADALEAQSRSVTLWIHGAVVGEAAWRLPVVSYDHAVELARLGHVSVTISRIGYEPSRGKGTQPVNGYLSCIPGDADIAHQIALDLRRGTYDVAGSKGPMFDRVAYAGQSGGASTAEVAAASFSDVDAVVLHGWGRYASASPDTGAAFTEFAPCATGGDANDEGLLGYARADLSPYREFFVENADPAAWQAFLDAGDFEPCGQLMSIPAIGLAQQLGPASLAASVSVPVLLINGDHDRFFPPDAAVQHAADFTAAPGGHADLVFVPGSGHLAQIDFAAPLFRQLLSDWLTKHGF